jgi:hypothetical protein
MRANVAGTRAKTRSIWVHIGYETRLLAGEGPTCPKRTGGEQAAQNWPRWLTTA